MISVLGGDISVGEDIVVMVVWRGNESDLREI
jgi:hypothetical protein